MATEQGQKGKDIERQRERGEKLREGKKKLRKRFHNELCHFDRIREFVSTFRSIFKI